MKDPEWILEKTVYAIHSEQIAEHSGHEGIRDEGLLQSALSHPQNFFHYGHCPSLFSLAAAYAYRIINNHPFIDGNKRTGYVVSLIFLLLNGYDLNVPSEEESIRIFLGVADNMISENELAIWFEKYSNKVE